MIRESAAYLKFHWVWEQETSQNKCKFLCSQRKASLLLYLLEKERKYSSGIYLPVYSIYLKNLITAQALKAEMPLIFPSCLFGHLSCFST